jgi:drug/metabolite transporter (DMT)-like permease
MLLLGGVVVSAMALALEPLLSHFRCPCGPAWLYGVLINYGFAQLIWFGMARDAACTTSAMSIMAIPLVGALSATVIVGEIPHWQDWLAMGWL